MHNVKPIGSTEPLLCSADFTGKENHLVNYASTGIALTNVDTESIVGVIENAAGSAEYADVRPWIPGGFYRVKVSAAVANGAFLEIDTSNPGQFVTRSAGTRRAQAMEAATDAGQIITVRAMTADGTT
jgi:hypothetical protein